MLRLVPPTAGLAPKGPPPSSITVRCHACGMLHTPAVTGRSEPVEQRALKMLAAELEGCHEDVWRFFSTLFGKAPGYASVRTLSRDLAVHPSSLMSRFYRAGLPSPKQYLVLAKLIRASAMLADPKFSGVYVSNELDYSSPQSFNRHVRIFMGCTITTFRTMYGPDDMIEILRKEYVAPHLDALRTFTPLTAPALPGSEAPRLRQQVG